MTKRERFLICCLAWLVVGLGALLVTSAILDDLQRLDSEYLRLQKVGIGYGSQTLLKGEGPQGSGHIPSLEAGFWPKGDLPPPLELARVVQPVLSQYGVEVKEVQVIRADPEAFVLRYSLRSPMGRFLRAAAQLQASLPRLQVWSFAASVGEKGDYLVQWEVGYAEAP